MCYVLQSIGLICGMQVDLNVIHVYVEEAHPEASFKASLINDDRTLIYD